MHFCFYTKKTGKIDLILEETTDEAYEIGFKLKDLISEEVRKLKAAESEPPTPEEVAAQQFLDSLNQRSKG